MNIEKKIIVINKNESIHSIINKITINENFFEKIIYQYLIKLSNKFNKHINYGSFKIDDNDSIIQIINTISSKSNLDYKITIIEGWEKYQLNEYLSSYYSDYKIPEYNNILADTYIINSSNTYKDLHDHLVQSKKSFFKQFKNNKLIDEFGINKILIISSLVEKEAQNKNDKKLIASVIFNRLKLNMKLQVDATVISSITNGKYKFNRNLNYNDLKIIHPLNTYVIKGLPNKMICYVGIETIKIVLENPKSDFLFYFFNVLENKHIFTKNFKEHKEKLYDYRKKI